MKNLAGFHRRLVCAGPKNPFEKLLLSVLVPFGWLYGMLGWLRSLCYRCGLMEIYRAEVPVIAVGNIAVGGTGKTPTVDYLVKFFHRQGKRVAVVSRGYGGSIRKGVAVVCDGEGPVLRAEICGDEPLLLARRNPRSMVLVAPRRKLGIATAVERGAEIVLLDDGFQHLAVARDLDCVLLDSRCPLGNGRPLPAGLLREFPSALGRAGLFLLTRWNQECRPLPLPGEVPVVRSRHRLENSLVGLDGQQVEVNRLAGLKGLAFSGIADPGQFFADLRRLGLELSAQMQFPDHVAYEEEQIRSIRRAAADLDFLVTTEKDGAKLAAGDFPLPCYQVPLAMDFLDQDVFERQLLAVFNKE